MKAVYCPYCGGRTKRNDGTSSGSQRWRCTACGASTTVRYDDTATRLDEFLGWLLSKDSQAAMPGGGRSFRRRTAEFWEVWPMPVPDGELHRVLYVDGIWVARELVVLICCSGERVVSWYMARSENSRAWSALMAPIPAPDVVVTDGGSGFAKAVRETWPRTRVQRCTFHRAFSQAKRYTTTRPKLQAGRELYLVARDLMGIEMLHQAELWVERYLDWCGFWADFLEDRTVVDGRRVYAHERLRRARSSLSSLVSAGTLFTYLDPALAKAAAVDQQHDRGRGELAAEGRPAQPPGADVGQAREGGVLVVPRALGGREDGAREARHDADRRGHRLPVQRLLRLAVARGRRAGVGRQGRVGGSPPQGPVPVLAGLMDRNGCSIWTHILSYKPLLKC